MTIALIVVGVLVGVALIVAALNFAHKKKEGDNRYQGVQTNPIYDMASPHGHSKNNALSESLLAE